LVDAGQLWKAENRKVFAARRSFGADGSAQTGGTRARVLRNFGIAWRNAAA
jgi:hypothetical protein